jgi:hypothetical protein
VKQPKNKPKKKSGTVKSRRGGKSGKPTPKIIDLDEDEDEEPKTKKPKKSKDVEITVNATLTKYIEMVYFFSN